jgi:hypothetical protein
VYRVHYFHHIRDDQGRIVSSRLRFCLSDKAGIEALKADGHSIVCTD